jgi:predicted dehydrogenase
VPCVASDIREIASECELDVAVVATPVEARPDVLGALPALKGMLVEKPLAASASDACAIVNRCRAAGVALQVNYWRRSDVLFRSLAAGRLQDLIGPVQFGSAVYGGGLHNNGTHIVDFIAMLFGSIVEVRANGPLSQARTLRGEEDWSVSFSLTAASGAVVDVHAIAFEHYRENSLDLWGQRGRLAIANEGLTVAHYPVAPNRAVRGELELPHDRPQFLTSTVGDALFHSYTALARAVCDGTPTDCPGEDAITAGRVVDAVLASARSNGAAVSVRAQ